MILNPSRNQLLSSTGDTTFYITLTIEQEDDEEEDEEDSRKDGNYLMFHSGLIDKFIPNSFRDTRDQKLPLVVLLMKKCDSFSEECNGYIRFL